MPPSHYDDTSAGASPKARADAGAEPGPEAEDEEAQLLTSEQERSIEREDFDVEDNPTPYTPSRRRIWDRLKGPQPPRPQSIKPFFASIQHAPLNLVDRIFPHETHKYALLAILIAIWAFVGLILLSAELPLRDQHGRDVVNLDCVDTLWRPRNECGIDGVDCRPFVNGSFAFRCPAKCADVKVLNPHAVGPLDVNYRPLVVGDGAYRGDSFICGSAIHAGVVRDGQGGCGRLEKLGEGLGFESTTKHGIESIGFDSYFPLSFSVVSTDAEFKCSTDPRTSLLALSLTFTVLISLAFSWPWLFFPLFTMVFAHISFASDPPSASYRNVTVLPDHISMFAKRLLPALFCAVVIYHTSVKRTLRDLTAQIEKTTLWLGGLWLGALSNYTLDWIPLSRLTAHDLSHQPGAKLALATILVLLVLIIAGQIVFFWLEGRLPRYLALYAGLVLSILLLVTIPGVNLRIHHYILALLLLPGTSMQTRPSLLYQGLLLGLFANGVARWDFDSILQTTAALRADGAFESAVPAVLAPVVEAARDGANVSATFRWAVPPASMDGISVLINDVERDRAFFDDEGVPGEFVWTRGRGWDEGVNEYFRFAYLRGGRALDYTAPGTWWGNGSWSMGLGG